MSDRKASAALFPLALQFLTRLPAPRAKFSPARLADAARWFPAVGLIVGGLGAAIFLASSLVLPQPMAAIAALATTALVTGALHEDGLADFSDGIGGGATRDKALEIMRDSRIGTYGALALGLSIAAQATALSSLTKASAAAGLMGAHALSRWAIVEVMGSLPYARASGTGDFAAQGIPAPARGVAAAMSIAALVLLAVATSPQAAVTAAILAALTTFSLRRLMRKKLLGWTGDSLGAVQQIACLACLIGLLAWQ